MKCLKIRRSVVVVIAIAAFAIHVCSQNQAGAIVAVDEGSGSSGSTEKSGTGTIKKSTGSREYGTSQTTKSKTTSSRNKPSRPGQPSTPVRSNGPYNGPVLGDTYSFLNFEVISAEKPIYRRAAKQSGAHGLVQVAILVDTDGSVLQAKARTGNKLLWDEAERAALASRLNRPMDNGRPARALGFLVYRFGAADEDDDDN